MTDLIFRKKDGLAVHRFADLGYLDQPGKRFGLSAHGRPAKAEAHATESHNPEPGHGETRL